MRKRMLISLMFFLFLGICCVQAKTIEYNKDAPRNKIWTIKFNEAFNPDSINNETVYLIDSKKNKIDIKINLIMDNKWVSIIPLSSLNSYEKYEIHILKNVKNLNNIPLNNDVIFKFRTGSHFENKLTLAWNYIYDKWANKKQYDSPDDNLNMKSKTLGLNIISPTWIDLKWENGNVVGITEKFDDTYLDKAKENGYSVWPCLQQLPHSIPDETVNEYITKMDKFMNDKMARSKVINDIVSLLKKNGLNGLSLDFEGMGKSNKDNYTLFSKELAEALHNEGIKFSVAVTEPVMYSIYSECYDINKLAQYSDYIMFMAYDEHWVGGAKSGSVGSYNWVENGIKKILNLDVPQNKLVLSVPFYMRDFAVVEASPKYDSVIVTKRAISSNITKLYSEPNSNSTVLKTCTYGDVFQIIKKAGSWYEVLYNGSIGYIPESRVSRIEGGKSHKIAVGWSTVLMKNIDKIINDKSLSPETHYDAEAKQDVLVYYKYDTANTVNLKHEIWLENEKSMTWRIELAKKYNLAGVAAWQMGYEKKSIWNVIKDLIDAPHPK